MLPHLFGQHNVSLDVSKNGFRIRIPTQYREIIGVSIKLLPSPDGCILGIPGQGASDIMVNPNDYTVTSVEGRRAIRKQFAELLKIVNRKVDRHNRFFITNELAALANLQGEREIVVAGLGGYIELWNPDDWNKQQAQDMLHQRLGEQ